MTTTRNWGIFINPVVILKSLFSFLLWVRANLFFHHSWFFFCQVPLIFWRAKRINWCCNIPHLEVRISLPTENSPVSQLHYKKTPSLMTLSLLSTKFSIRRKKLEDNHQFSPCSEGERNVNWDGSIEDRRSMIDWWKEPSIEIMALKKKRCLIDWLTGDSIVFLSNGK